MKLAIIVLAVLLTECGTIPAPQATGVTISIGDGGITLCGTVMPDQLADAGFTAKGDK